jgi:glycosyltransferase involved in cell wall biosynthesis
MVTNKISTRKKPVLLYFITASCTGGAQSNLFDLISSFHDSYEVYLAVGSTGVLTEKAKSLDVSICIIGSLGRNIDLVNDVVCVKRIIDLIRVVNPDLIHAHSSKAGAIARIAGKLCCVPVVFTAHGWGFSPGTPRVRGAIALLVEKFLASISSRIICVSDSDRQLALKLGVGNRKVLSTVRCAIRNSTVTLAQPAIQGLRLIMVARFNEQKDQATLLNAIAQIPDFSGHVDFVGSGPSLESCKSLADDLGISQKVSFLGDRRDVPDLLARSQIFVLATHYEGLPISILEAMRSGLPVIASDVNGIPEEVEHDVTGLVVPPRDSYALANAIRSLVASPDIRRSMGKAARQKFEREFTIERMVRETAEIYEELLADKDLRKKEKVVTG